jgi:hypothetical protein
MTHRKLKDGDYDLIDGAIWLTVNDISVRVRSDGELVIVEMYPVGMECEDPIAVTCASNADIVMRNPSEVTP